jgi:Glycosyl transferase family 2
MSATEPSSGTSAAAWAERFAAIEEAIRALGSPRPRRAYAIGSRTLEIAAPSSEAALWLDLPIRHLSAPPGSAAQLDVLIGHGPEPGLDALWAAGGRGAEDLRRPRLALGDGRQLVGGLWPHAGVMGLLDRGRRRALLWVRDPGRASPADAATLFRALVAWWLAELDAVVVHAAAVAGPGGAALLVGPSGSGKSSTAVACFEAGLSVLGDDSVLCRAGEAEVLSLCSCAHLHHGDLEDHHRALGAVRIGLADEGGKVVVDLAALDPERVPRRAPLRALVRLTMRPAGPSRLQPIARSRALAAMAPSSLFNVPGLRRRALSAMAAITRGAPAYELELSPDRPEGARLLAELLAGAERRDAQPPLVSVIVPVRDGERFLAEAIESVLAQDYAPLELIVVDDGSVDGSARIAGSYQQVRLLRLPGHGVAAARNAGVEAASGELLAFLDQDDVWSPRKLNLQVAALLADQSLAFALGHQRLFLEPGTPPPAWLSVSELDGEHVGHFPGTLLVRRRAFERVGGFDQDAVPAEGADWFMRAAELGLRRAIVPELVLSKRVHDANQSGDMSGARRQVLRAIKGSLDRRRSVVQ